MSSGIPQIQRLLSDVERFLRQQQELYGDVLLAGSDHTVTSSTVMAKKTPSSDADRNLFESPLPAPVPSVPGFPNEPWVNCATLADLNMTICGCQKCTLGSTRKNFVFGVGNPQADLVLVGEAPGADEDLKGEPFVGRAGQLLNKILEAINFKREEVFICNILKCRPPNNRDPLPEEVAQCEPYLWKQLEIIKPKIILCLGRIAAQVLLKTNDSLTKLRGTTHDYRGIKLMVTYHPAALLRNPNWKRPAWEDVQRLRKEYDAMKEKS
jgi:DNA polymerase